MKMKTIAAAPYRIFSAVDAAYAVIGCAMGAATQVSARAAEILRFFHDLIETPPHHDRVILLVILYHKKGAGSGLAQGAGRPLIGDESLT